MHIVWLVVVIVAFVGGLDYGKSMAPAAGTPGANGNFAARAGRGGAGGGGFTAGTITAMDSQSITVQLTNGNSEVVFYSPSTSVVEPSMVPASTLKTGMTVMVGGTQNSDGSITASTIQVRPAGSPGFGGGPRGSASSTNQ